MVMIVSRHRNCDGGDVDGREGMNDSIYILEEKRNYKLNNGLFPHLSTSITRSMYIVHIVQYLHLLFFMYGTAHKRSILYRPNELTLGDFNFKIKH